MEYYIKRTMKGAFPGSPDYDYCVITEAEFNMLSELLKGRLRNTLEDAKRCD